MSSVTIPKVREACRQRMPLDGADAQALEHALTITERERDEARAEASAARIARINVQTERDAAWGTTKMVEQMMAERDEARAEVVRLDEFLTRQKELCQGHVDAAQAEVARLIEENARYHAEIIGWNNPPLSEQLAASQAEVARLKTANAGRAFSQRMEALEAVNTHALAMMTRVGCYPEPPADNDDYAKGGLRHTAPDVRRLAQALAAIDKVKP